MVRSYQFVVIFEPILTKYPHSHVLLSVQYICGKFRKNRKFPLLQFIWGNFRKIRIFPLHPELVQKGNLSETISDSGVCTILYAAKVAELSDKGVSESSSNNLVLYLGQNNQDGKLLKQMRSEITHLMHDLSQKYSSVCVHDSQKKIPSLFHSSQDKSSSACGDSTKQALVFTDDSATSI
jgi:hypothetical protein